MKTTFLFALCCAACGARAELIPLSPVKGAAVPLVPPAQKQVMTLKSLEERLACFAADDKPGKKILKHDKLWRRALPFVLNVSATNGENGPWKVLIGRKPDLSDARVWYVPTAKSNAITGREMAVQKSEGAVSIEVPRANLEIGTRYYWKVSCRGRCGFGCSPQHKCKEAKVFAETPVSEFVTEDFAPRWIAIEGNVANIRDLGGRRTASGKHVRQGLVYRGQGLNDNSVTGEHRGRNRLTVEDVDYLTKTLGIRTDLDLRGPGETADLGESPLGPGVKLIKRSSPAYEGIFHKDGKRTMAENFRVFCDEKNYPIYFHCIGGADRTGSLAYVLNGVLGVSRHELETDFESTFYPKIPDADPNPKSWRRESHFNTGFAKYGKEGDTWNKRIILYLRDCGVTMDEINRFREIMQQ